MCSSCKLESVKWLGKCPNCGEWNTFEEQVTSRPKTKNSQTATVIYNIPKSIEAIQLIEFERIKTKISEFDRVMGGGITSGSLTLLGGEPGVGKSTLLMEICRAIIQEQNLGKLLYISGEESEAQIANRAKRIGLSSNSLLIYNATNLQKILEQLKLLKPPLFILDSIQTTYTDDHDSGTGSASQIREVTYELMNYVKGTNTTCIVVGHVTKDGTIAGPKLLEHMVDTVIYFEGDQNGDHRILRTSKNRFGNTNEVGIFKMSEQGLKEISNPLNLFVGNDSTNSFGRSITCVLEGSRPIMVEIQSLVVENKLGNGRRVAQGIDGNRLSLLIAIIDKYFEIPLSYNDIYVNVVGGLKLGERGSDLPIIASLLSSFHKVPIPSDVAFFGEVGLTGEVRSHSNIDLITNELKRLRYSKLITSFNSGAGKDDIKNLEIIGISKVLELNNLIE